MHIVVTGGAGFIASHIVDGYVARGWDVTVVDDLSTGERSNVNPKARLVVGSVTDPAVVAEVVKPGVDLLNHHAAQMDVRRSVADPVFDAEQNIIASLRLLEQVVKAGVRSVIFASSGGAAYGEPVFVPQNEDHPFAPMSPYGCAKLSVEHYLGFYRQVHGIRAVALRYGNVYGPRQKKHGEAGVVAIFAGKMLAGETVTINGTGMQTRDYVFVEDVVRANMAASDSELSGAFNVGTGIETNVVELFDAMCDVVGGAFPSVHAAAKAGEQLRSVLDGAKLRRIASLPDPVCLTDGLRATVEWIRHSAS
ncbi:MAG: NAD-dependent epimerase/dehydratase family protein [Thermoanaerobaculia bacterium]